MRKTKIVCTVGPACEDAATLSAMIRAGMNVARLNFSHGTHEQHQQKIDLLKQVREDLGVPLAIMLDTKGPEYRIRTFENGSVELTEGQTFTFTTDQSIIGDNTRVAVSYEGMTADLAVGDTILVNNGLLVFRVDSLSGAEAVCTVLEGGIMSDRKSMAFPGKVLKQVYLSEQDKADLLFGIRNDVDFIACSFVSSRQDLLDVKEFLNANGGGHIDIIAKIENRSGVENIEEICAECNGIMVARGDLGVEIPYEELPAIQKLLIDKCRLLGKRVITATEMLESMIHNVRPTRAEISDVANAVYDGTSAIMLSGETAAGEHPVLAVEAMARIAERTETTINYEKRFRQSEFRIRSTVDALSHATCGMAIDIGAAAIAVCTLSGMTARMVSRFRPPVDITGLTTDERTWRRLALSWGVTPVLCEMFNSTDVLFYTAKNLTKQTLGLKKGDRLMLTGGITNGCSGNTDIIKLETV
ncbi:MAG: pyruvate kinase [Oscillospiraceae bacterium]|nr:pyruvate kinase [Oscillospiraceae bacterium]